MLLTNRSAFSSPLNLQRITNLITLFFGSIPLSIGRRLRQSTYHLILGRLGLGVTIETSVLLRGAQTIELGNEVNIDRYVALDCDSPGSRLIFGNVSTVSQGTQITPAGGTTSIGDRTWIGPYVCIGGPGNIRIGKDCMIASHCAIYANNHIFDDPTRPINQQGVTTQGISIGDDCWLGTGVKVLDGVTIGKGSVIGAGSVVTKNIPPYSVAVGVPARVIKNRSL